MHDVLRDRLMRHVEALPEAQLYQVLDYIEFLSSKYAREGVRTPNPVQKFTELLEDKMRGQGLAVGTIRGAMGVMGTAGRMVSGITEAGRNVLREVEQVVLPPADTRPSPPPLKQPDGDPDSGPRDGGTA